MRRISTAVLATSPEDMVSAHISNISPSRHTDGGHTLLRPNYGSGNSTSIPVQRPSLDRSPSSPTSQTTHHTLHSVQTVPSTVEPEREWSLFGQLMENEWSASRLRLRSSQQSANPSGSNGERLGALGRDTLSSHTSSILSEPSITYEPASLNDQPARHPEMEGYDSEDSVTGEQTQGMKSRLQYLRWLHVPKLSRLQKNVIKCALAYFIASLFTFAPYFSGFLSDISSGGKGEGPSPAGHMVATASVYYNPAKTMGGMVEADIYVIFGLAFCSFVSLGSMSMFWFFEVRPGWEYFATILALIWIAGAMCMIAWLKVWMARPTFNAACSMISIILFIVVVREGGIETLVQASSSIIVGSLVSNFVCLVLWTQSATKNLQDDINATLDSYATLLQLITRTFLLDPDFHPEQAKLHGAVEAHQKSFTSLKRNLTEAQSEWLCSSSRGGSNSIPYDDAVDSLNRLAQHLGGLRSGTQLQADLARAHREGKLVLQHGARNKEFLVPATPVTGQESNGATNGKTSNQDEEDAAILAAAAVMFGDLVDDVESPMNALSKTCTLALKRMKAAFERPRDRDSSLGSHEFGQIAEDIERALFTFDSTSNHALMRLYRRNDMTDQGSTISEDDLLPALSNGGNETVFLVYFFIFTLQEFAKELVSLVDAMGRIYVLELNASARSSIGQWVRLNQGSRRGLRRRLSTLMPTENTLRKAVFFPRVRPHAPNTMQTPSRSSLSFMGRLKQSFWALGKRLKEPDLKYAFKVGIATAMLASPAFFDTTRPIFNDYRGEWALISFFVVMSPTIGGTNFLSLHRILGTLLGAFTAVIAYLCFHNQPIILALFGFFFAIPCFYYLISLPRYATSMRFILLAYNLTCLYCYNLRQENLSVISIAYHRSVAVTVGVVWAFLVSQFWWPSEARRELGKSLGEFCLNLGWLYSRMVMHYSSPPDALLRPRPDSGEEATATTPLLSGRPRSTLTARASDQLNSSIHDFMAMELHLQRNLIALQDLLAQTQHEPRLKGPFPVKLYRSILTSLQTILDKMHSMRCVTTREEWYTSVRRDFILPVTKERREMVGNVILYFSTLSAAFRLKAPLPPYLPPAEKSRQELVRAIRDLEVVKARNVKGSRQLLYFAYALMMQGVIQELDFLGKTLQDAFGVLGGDTQSFENLFRAEAIEVEEASTGTRH